MSMTIWNPFREMEAIRREVERAFGNFGERRRWWPFFGAPFLPEYSARAFPLVNLSEDANNVYVEALAPGVNPDTLDITVIRNTMRISGEKQALSEKIKPEDFHRQEREAGNFVRVITLPVEVQSDKVKAEYKNGLHLVTMPIAELAKPNRITVIVT